MKNYTNFFTNSHIEAALKQAIALLLIFWRGIFTKSKKKIYFDKENHDIEKTNTETFMCRSMSATNAYTELQMIRK